FRLEVLTDPSLPKMGPGRSPSNGNFVVNEFKASARKTGDKEKPKPVTLRGAVADYSQPGWDVNGAIDGNPDTGWATDPQGRKAHAAMVKVTEPVGFDGGTEFTVTLDQRWPGKDHNLGKFRISVTTSKEPMLKEQLAANIQAAVAVPLDKRTPEQKALVTNYF